MASFLISGCTGCALEDLNPEQLIPEQFTLETEVRVSSEASSFARSLDVVLGVFHVFDDTLALGAVACYSEGHPFRDDGFYSRSISGAQGEQVIERFEGDDFISFSSYSASDCDLDTIQIGAELWTLPGIEGCDGMSQASSEDREIAGTLVASLYTSATASDGVCWQATAEEPMYTRDLEGESPGLVPMVLELNAGQLVEVQVDE